MSRVGVLQPGYAGGWQWSVEGEQVAAADFRVEHSHLTLTYSRRAEEGERPRRVLQNVLLSRTPCHVGGERLWFICPTRDCGRRVAILYYLGTFACRHCCHLAYPSSRENREDRAMRRAERLRARLGWDPGIYSGDGPKPKWMRYRTFERLVVQHDAFAEQSAQEWFVRMARLPSS